MLCIGRMNVPPLTTRLAADAVRHSGIGYDAAAGGWTVLTTYGASGREKTERLTRQRGGTRLFATLEAAARCLASLGISEFPVAAREWHALASSA
jgi:hypothetical protein